MPYTKQTWVDRVVEFANRFTKSGESSTQVTLTPDPGTVTEAGTPLSASNLNKIEQGIEDAHTAAAAAQDTADAALPTDGGKIDDADALTTTGIYYTDDAWTGSPFSGTSFANQGYLQHYNWSPGYPYRLQVHTPINQQIARRYRTQNNGTWGAWITLWDSGNDGAGSGLDADKLDGQEGSYYLPKSGGTMTGRLTIDGFGSTSRDLSFRSGFAPESVGGIGIKAADHSGSAADGLNIYGYDGIRLISSNGKVAIGTDATNEVWHDGRLRWNTDGYLEYNDGGTWRAMGEVPMGKPRTASVQSSGTWATVVDVSGTPGRLEWVYAANTGTTDKTIKVTIDGEVDTFGPIASAADYLALRYGGSSATYGPASSSIPFYSSLKVEYMISGNTTPCTVMYRLKAGTA